MSIERKLTVGCMMLAGLVIVPSILFNKPIIALFGVIIDFLPTTFGWFRKTMTTIPFPVVFSVVALTYLLFIVWLFAPRILAVRILFAEFWFLSVTARIE